MCRAVAKGMVGSNITGAGIFGTQSDRIDDSSQSGQLRRSFIKSANRSDNKQNSLGQDEPPNGSRIDKSMYQVFWSLTRTAEARDEEESMCIRLYADLRSSLRIQIFLLRRRDLKLTI